MLIVVWSAAFCGCVPDSCVWPLILTRLASDYPCLLLALTSGLTKDSTFCSSLTFSPLPEFTCGLTVLLSTIYAWSAHPLPTQLVWPCIQVFLPATASSVQLLIFRFPGSGCAFTVCKQPSPEPVCLHPAVLLSHLPSATSACCQPLLSVNHWILPAQTTGLIMGTLTSPCSKGYYPTISGPRALAVQRAFLCMSGMSDVLSMSVFFYFLLQSRKKLTQWDMDCK